MSFGPKFLGGLFVIGGILLFVIDKRKKVKLTKIVEE
jgi:hypothetical protein